MTSVEELQGMIARGEDTQTEFKEELSEEVLKGLSTDIAAIANSQGGRIVLGVTDEKDPKGLKLTGDEFNRISQAASNCLPAVRAEPEEIKFGTRSFIVVKIPKSTVLHNDQQKRFPLRLGTTTHYLDALEMATILQERGFLKGDGGGAITFQVVDQERLPIAEPESAKIINRLRSENRTVRIETLRDLVSIQYRTQLLPNAKIADAIGTILSKGDTEELKPILDLFGYAAPWGVSDEKKILSGWSNTLLKIGRSSDRPDIQRSVFNVLAASKNRGVVDLVVHWLMSLDDPSWTSLQVTGMMMPLRDLRYQLQDELYKILENPKDETAGKRSLAVLEALRQVS